MPFLSLQVLRHSTSVNVATFHAYSGWSPSYEFGKRMMARFARRLHGRIAVSAAARHFISRYFPGEYKVIPNGVDLREFQGVPPFARWRDGTPNILFIGRFESRKGLMYLLKAYRSCAATATACRLLLVGAGPQERDARRYIATRRLQGVEFLGRVSEADKARAFATADIFVSPATGQESFGIVLLEAMAAGKPIVCCDIHGYKGVVRRGEQALLVPPKRLRRAGGGAIGQLLRDPALRARMGESGRERAVQFGWASVTAKVDDYYGFVIRRLAAAGTAAPGLQLARAGGPRARGPDARAVGRRPPRGRTCPGRGGPATGGRLTIGPGRGREGCGARGLRLSGARSAATSITREREPVRRRARGGLIASPIRRYAAAAAARTARSVTAATTSVAMSTSPPPTGRSRLTANWKSQFQVGRRPWYAEATSLGRGRPERFGYHTRNQRAAAPRTPMTKRRASRARSAMAAGTARSTRTTRASDSGATTIEKAGSGLSAVRATSTPPSVTRTTASSARRDQLARGARAREVRQASQAAHDGSEGQEEGGRERRVAHVHGPRGCAAGLPARVGGLGPGEPGTAVRAAARAGARP